MAFNTYFLYPEGLHIDLPHPDLLVPWIEGYCEGHPRTDIQEAATALISDLMLNR